LNADFILQYKIPVFVCLGFFTLGARSPV